MVIHHRAHRHFVGQTYRVFICRVRWDGELRNVNAQYPKRNKLQISFAIRNSNKSPCARREMDLFAYRELQMRFLFSFPNNKKISIIILVVFISMLSGLCIYSIPSGVHAQRLRGAEKKSNCMCNAYHMQHQFYSVFMLLLLIMQITHAQGMSKFRSDLLLSRLT